MSGVGEVSKENAQEINDLTTRTEIEDSAKLELILDQLRQINLHLSFITGIEIRENTYTE